MAKRKSILPYAHRKRPRTVPRARARGLRRARPMRALYAKQAYRKLNQYRFCRETLPKTTKMSIIPAEGTGENRIPAMGYLQFSTVTPEDLANFTSEFGPLFAKFKVDKIVTTLTPITEGAYAGTHDAVQPNNADAWNQSPQCIVTRVNGKYLNEPMDIKANARLQLTELAQIQAKTKSKMLSHKSVYLVTVNPGIRDVINPDVEDPADREIVKGPNRWLNITGQSGTHYCHNDTVFVERVDGDDVTTDFKYRVTHKFYFRTAFVG